MRHWVPLSKQQNHVRLAVGIHCNTTRTRMVGQEALFNTNIYSPLIICMNMNMTSAMSATAKTKRVPKTGLEFLEIFKSAIKDSP